MAMKVITLDQRTNDWHIWRAMGIGASEVAAVLGISPFQKPQQLWELKTGRRDPVKLNRAMLKGMNDEPLALAAYENMTGNIMRPLCAEDVRYPFIRASFDGLRIDGKRAVEIKCPGMKTHQFVINNNLDEELARHISMKSHQNALDGIIPEYYRAQMMQQMYVGDLEEMDYFSYMKEYPDPKKRAVLIPIKRSDAEIDRLVKADIDFWDHVMKDIPLYIDGWESAAEEFLYAKSVLEEGKALELRAKNKLIALAGPKDMQGHGVSLTHTSKSGSVDWQKLAKDLGADLNPELVEQYRAEGSESITIRQIKSAPNESKKPFDKDTMAVQIKRETDNNLPEFAF